MSGKLSIRVFRNLKINIHSKSTAYKIITRRKETLCGVFILYKFQVRAHRLVYVQVKQDLSVELYDPM